jgi:hypothetical protein
LGVNNGDKAAGENATPHQFPNVFLGSFHILVFFDIRALFCPDSNFLSLPEREMRTQRTFLSGITTKWPHQQSTPGRATWRASRCLLISPQKIGRDFDRGFESSQRKDSTPRKCEASRLW